MYDNVILVGKYKFLKTLIDYGHYLGHYFFQSNNVH